MKDLNEKHQEEMKKIWVDELVEDYRMYVENMTYWQLDKYRKMESWDYPARG